MSMFEGKRELFYPGMPPPSLEFSFLALGNKFQNLSVSSPAPVTMLEPQGLIDKNRTL